MEQKIKNSCENCAHFVRHYIKDSPVSLRPICYGHCLDHYLSAKEKRAIPLIYDCPSWQPAEIAHEKQFQSLRRNMQIIAERMDEIALVLKDRIDEV